MGEARYVKGLGPYDGLLQTATDPHDVLALTDPAAPDPEGDGPLKDSLRHPGAEGQSQRLRALPWLNLEATTERGRRVEGSLTESPGDAAKRTTSKSTPEGSRGDITTNAGAGTCHGDPQSSTSGAGGAQ
ncbi:hypothetical protein NDU88_003383 [Pleurodeles waltl]|uniref:Uncharacterized protein n=1 Tax=Pleurodeles waltl TaxID=8319 RepID=A0AAV7T547_PLEWA|nr:hypothetical protein NDU88_003383 [Pleurodeles waltl]